ncbi:MAG: aminotransferase class III-fold pyridoxal phosphate-dependent enzyme, partial [Pricia sp.]|nr:aminotransferase class III-fold pyridoxal phosphate-dependent enzyme [Pricia sp.]
MDQDNPQKIENNKFTEGDVNFTPARENYVNDEVSEAAKQLLDKDARYFFHQSLSTPCLDVLKTCKGSYIENVSGKKYLDFHGNNVHQLGFSHPKLVQRLTEQLQSLTFSTRRYTNEMAINFAEKLASVLPSDLNRTLLTPNGSSAIGIALKLARAVTGKFKVVSFWDSFHGASLDTISVGGEAVFREYMGPLMPGVGRIPPPITYRGIFENNEAKCLEHLEYVFAKEGDIGAFLAETVRNTDVQIPSKKFW